MGSTITAETIIDGTNTTYIEYFYDNYGPYGFSIDGTFYYYVKNLQGDVTQIRDVNNNLIASYVYDAWGKVLSVTENNTNNIGSKNAIRYRGYYYDTESNLYYLNARYYDPQIKRFLNPDGLLGANGGVIGYNMYAYCNNNPVSFSDPDGLSCRACNYIFDVGGGSDMLAVMAIGAGTAIALGAAANPDIVTDTFESFVNGITSVGDSIKNWVVKKIAEKTEGKSYSIYVLIDEDDKVQYVGRTSDVEKRKAAHERNPHRKGLKFVVIASDLNYEQSRAFEQAAMAFYHTINTVDKKNNQINGIKPTDWDIYKMLAEFTLKYGYNQMTNEIMFWIEQ